MNIGSLVFLVKNGKVLLARKARGIGKGKWNGYGGRKKGSEPLRKTAVRELREEAGVTAVERDLLKVTTARFFFKKNTEHVNLWTVHVFLCKKWQGEVVETSEMRDPRWFPIDKLPLEQMMAGDREWLPKIFELNKLCVRVYYGKDTRTVESSIWRGQGFRS